LTGELSYHGEFTAGEDEVKGAVDDRIVEQIREK